jgi:hypothetical protein
MCILQKVCIDHILVSIIKPSEFLIFSQAKEVGDKACPEGKNMDTGGINIIILSPIVRHVTGMVRIT